MNKGVLAITVANAFACATLASLSAHAADDTKRVCLAAAENAQRLRQDGKLTAARKELLVCGASNCPGAVRNDCITWLNQVTDLMPSIVIIARDEKGDDLSDVRVKFDGEILTEKLDGRSLSVSTGEHVIVLEHQGALPIEKKILMHEGESARRIEVTFAREGAPPPPPKSVEATPPPPTAPPPPPAPNDTEKTGQSSINKAPLIVASVGAAALITGIVVFVVGKANFPAGCDASSGTCENYFDNGTPVPATSSSSSGTAPDCSPPTGLSSNDGCQNSTVNKKRQQNAGSNSSFISTGPVIAVSGGVVLAGGLIWYFIVPRSHSSAPTSLVYPIVNDKFGGLGFTTTF